MTPRLAFDIETCPLPEAAYSDRQKRRRDIERARIMRLKPDMSEDDADRLARSTHAHLGWVCSIALAHNYSASATGEGVPADWTLAVPAPSGELHLLHQFQGFLMALRKRGVDLQVVSFNGKRFDADFFKMRCLAVGLTVLGAARPVLHSHRWQDHPHLDLMHKVPMGWGLADLCDLLGVETPKDDIDGSQVQGCIERGETDRVARYCLADTVATLRCYERMAALGLA